MDWMNWKTWTTVGVILIAIFAIYSFASTSKIRRCAAGVVAAGHGTAYASRIEERRHARRTLHPQRMARGAAGSYKIARNLFAYVGAASSAATTADQGAAASAGQGQRRRSRLPRQLSDLLQPRPERQHGRRRATCAIRTIRLGSLPIRPSLRARPAAITMKYIGTFGPVNNPIATFNGNGEIVNVRIGETIDGKFVLRSIGIESVEIGYVGSRPTSRPGAPRPVTFTKRYRQSDQQITHADHPGSETNETYESRIHSHRLVADAALVHELQRVSKSQDRRGDERTGMKPSSNTRKRSTSIPRTRSTRSNLSARKLEASRVHFQKGKSLRASALNARGEDQIRLTQLAATELELVIKLDPTNQYAAVEYGKAVTHCAKPRWPISGLHRRAEENAPKRTSPSPLLPSSARSSDQPITLSFPHETPVKEIYKALAGAFGINILFDQAVKDDRIAIELKDVTAQQALERLMQAANHFYKALDEHTIIVIPDNPQPAATTRTWSSARSICRTATPSRSPTSSGP